MIRDVDLEVSTAEQARALRRLAVARRRCDAAAEAPFTIQAIATDKLLDAEAFCRELGAEETA